MNYERIIIITIVAVLTSFLIYKMFWEIIDYRQRDITREMKAQNQFFMNNCYRHELSNWKSCKDKLRDLNNSPYHNE